MVYGELVRSAVEFEQTDITLYYELLDRVVSLDLGLNTRYVDSRMQTSGEISGSESADVSGWAPMLYAAVGGELPFTGLSLGAQGSLIQ